jgi:hypothetical protein
MTTQLSGVQLYQIGLTVANMLMVHCVQHKVKMALENEDCLRQFFSRASARDNESCLT